MEKYTAKLFYNDGEVRVIENVTGYKLERINMVQFETVTGCEIFKLDNVIGFNMVKVEG